MGDIREYFNIKIESPYWDKAYAKALADPPVPEWISEEYIRALQTEKGVLPRQAETLITVIPHVAANHNLCLLAKTLYYLLDTKKNFSNLFTEFELPKVPDDAKDAIAYECFAIFPVLAHLVPTWNELKSRGVPDNILTDSLHWADTVFTEAIRRNQRPVFHTEEFKLYGVCIYVNHLTIGPLRFEIYNNSRRPVRIFKNTKGEYLPLIDDESIHKDGFILGSCGKENKDGSFYADIEETNDSFIGYTLDQNSRLVQRDKVILLKNEWEQVYSSGDSAIKVHIPYNSKLTKEACHDSYKRAKKFLHNAFRNIVLSAF